MPISFVWIDRSNLVISLLGVVVKKNLAAPDSQGIATDGKHIFLWSERLVKYDMEGNQLAKSPPSKWHHGGMTYNDGKIFCAVSECSPEGTDKHWVFVYDSGSLKKIIEYDIGNYFSICAGGIEYYNRHFYVAESYFDNDHSDYIVEFDMDFNHVDSYQTSFKSPYGIQGLAYLPGLDKFQIHSHGNEFYRINTDFDDSTIEVGMASFPVGLQDLAYLDESTIIYVANGRGGLAIAFAELTRQSDRSVQEIRA